MGEAGGTTLKMEIYSLHCIICTIKHSRNEEGEGPGSVSYSAHHVTILGLRAQILLLYFKFLKKYTFMNSKYL
jgi:hypothetical protein